MSTNLQPVATAIPLIQSFTVRFGGLRRDLSDGRRWTVTTNLCHRYLVTMWQDEDGLRRGECSCGEGCCHHLFEAAKSDRVLFAKVIKAGQARARQAVNARMAEWYGVTQ